MRFDSGSPPRCLTSPARAMPALAARGRRGLVLVLGLAAASMASGCHGDQSPSLSVVTAAPAYPDSPGSSTLASDSPVVALAGYDGDVLAGTSGGVFRVGEAGLEPVDVVADDGEPTTTGAVRAIYHRTDGLIIAAENGFFTTYEWVLTLSPITEALAGLDVVDLDSTGLDADEVTWVAASQGLFRLTPGSLDAVTLPGVSGGATAVGALEQLVLVAFGSSLYEVSTADLSVHQAPDVGTIRRVVVSGDTAWLATDRGLVERDPDGAYTLFTLSGSSSGQPVDDLAVDVDQDPVLVASSGVVRVSGRDLKGIVATAGAERSLALDAFGNIWIGDGSTLTRFDVGQPVSFAGQVSPIFGARCNVCHLDGASAPKHDFTDYGQVMAMSDSILSRVLSGQMPPTGPLPEEEYQVIVLWDKSGLSP